MLMGFWVQGLGLVLHQRPQTAPFLQKSPEKKPPRAWQYRGLQNGALRIKESSPLSRRVNCFLTGAVVVVDS